MTWLLSKLAGYLLPAAVVVLAVLLLALGVQTKRVTWAKADVQECKNAAALGRANATAAALQQSEMNAAITASRINEQKRIADEAERKLAQARADAAIADAAAGKLRDRIAAYVAAARQAASNPAVIGAIQTADDPIGVLADVLSRADARAGLLARLADQRGAAGESCERQYDSLEVTP